MDRCVLFAVLCTNIVLLVPACGGVCPPGGVTERGVPEQLKPQIVKIHNEFRRQNALGKVAGQPKASNMLKLTWDESIAQTAQVLANTCEFKHVKMNDRRFLVGQNLHTSYTSEDKQGADWQKCVKSWFDENKMYNFGKSAFNHYTQVVWATSYKVGCGYVKYKKSNGFQRLYVCHYGPSGNMLGQTPYTVGEGCERLCMSKNVTMDKSEGVQPENVKLPPLKRPTIQLPPKVQPKPKLITLPPKIRSTTQRTPKVQPKQKLITLPPKIRPITQRMPKVQSKPVPPLPKKPEAKPVNKPSKEDALVAMILYLLAQKQAEAKAKKAQAEQQGEETEDYYPEAEDEYDGQPDYEEDVPDDQGFDEDGYDEQPEYDEENVPQKDDQGYDGDEYDEQPEYEDDVPGTDDQRYDDNGQYYPEADNKYDTETDDGYYDENQQHYPEEYNNENQKYYYPEQYVNKKQKYPYPDYDRNYGHYIENGEYYPQEYYDQNGEYNNGDQQNEEYDDNEYSYNAGNDL